MAGFAQKAGRIADFTLERVLFEICRRIARTKK
jgi:hypothetical protein